MRLHNLFRRKRVFPALCLALGLAVFGVTYSVQGFNLQTTEPNTDDFLQLQDVLFTTRDAAQLKKVLQSGVDPNATNSNGQPFLSVLLAERGIKSVAYGLVIVLLEYGANPNQIGEGGWTPMHWAARLGDEAIVTAMLKVGGNATSSEQAGVPAPIEIAAVRIHRGVISAIKQFTSYQSDWLSSMEKRFALREALSEIFNSSPGTLSADDVQAIVRRGVASMKHAGGIKNKKHGEDVFQGTIDAIKEAIEAGELPALAHLRGRFPNITDGE